MNSRATRLLTNSTRSLVVRLWNRRCFLSSSTALVGPKGGDIRLRARYDIEPWGGPVSTRCPDADWAAMLVAGWQPQSEPEGMPQLDGTAQRNAAADHSKAPRKECSAHLRSLFRKRWWVVAESLVR